MKVKRKQFVEELQVVLGTAEGPDPARVFFRGFMARMLSPTVDWQITPTHFVTERRFPRVHIRGFHSISSGALWASRGYIALSLPQYVHLLVSALWRKSKPTLPRAWIHR